MVSLSSTRTPRSFSAELLSSRFVYKAMVQSYKFIQQFIKMHMCMHRCFMGFFMVSLSLSGSVIIGQGVMVLNCKRINVDYTLGRNLLLFFTMRVVRHWNRLPREYPWKCSRPGWTGLWASWSSRRCACPWQRGWNSMIFKGPSNPNHSIIPIAACSRCL